MKTYKSVVLPLAYVCLLISASQTHARDVEGQVEDISQWTQDQIHNYLTKYQIVYDQNADDQSLLETIKRYRDAAVANTNIFMNDQTEGLSRILEGLKVKLEKNYQLSQKDVQLLVDEIQQSLNELGSQGVTQLKVKQALEKLKHNVVGSKHITDAVWKEISEDITSNYANLGWYERLFGGAHNYPENTFHTWLEKTGIPQRLEKNEKLTKEQVESISTVLTSSVTSAAGSLPNLSKLGSTEWWATVAKDIEKKTKLQQDQVQAIVDSMKDQVNAYKIYAIDNLNAATSAPQHVISKASDYIKQSGYSLYHAITGSLWSHPKAVKDNIVSTASAASSYASSVSSDAAKTAASLTKEAGEAVSSATEAVSSSASSVHAQVTDTMNDVKDSFGQYWRQKELQAYKKLGYTEAHIDWISAYLSSTFRHKSAVTKDTTQQAIKNIRQYLIDSKIQTESHIDARLKSLQDCIESWRRKMRDEF